MKRIVILGSTGSIGLSTLDIVDQHPDQFQVIGLACRQDIDCLARQIRHYQPKAVSVENEKLAAALKSKIGSLSCEILVGVGGATTIATLSEADIVVAAIVGAAGLLPTYAAIEAGKVVALANKETLVTGGEIVTKRVKECGARLLPVDSEHSAIFQCLNSHNGEEVKRIILTASGGPFLNTPIANLCNAGVEEALDHPNWKMGSKITIDSATMMNKGLELIEARWLFDIEPKKIDVVIHPQSIIHSMVEYIDGSILAELSHPDMRGPIAYALSYPKRITTSMKAMDFTEVGQMTFFKPDLEKFRCLDLARQAIESGANYPAVLNAANEVAVSAFLARRISFLGISDLVSKTINQSKRTPLNSIDDVLECDRQARILAESLL